MNIDVELIFTDMKYKKTIPLIFGDKKSSSYIHCGNTQAGIKRRRTEGYVLRKNSGLSLQVNRRGFVL
jgi:hypothetical protein